MSKKKDDPRVPLALCRTRAWNTQLVLLKVAQNSFQHLAFDGSLLNHSLSFDATTDHVIKICSIISEHCHFRDRVGFHSNSMTC